MENHERKFLLHFPLPADTSEPKENPLAEKPETNVLPTYVQSVMSGFFPLWYLSDVKWSKDRNKLYVFFEGRKYKDPLPKKRILFVIQ